MKEENAKNTTTNYKKQIEEAINDLKTPGKRKKQIPNLLTASRLLSPLLIIPAALTGATSFAAISAAIFGFTDLIDGFIAKTFNLKSELGADLDAFTDKIFAGTLLIAGAIFNPVLISNIILEMAIAGVNIKQKLSGNESGSTLIGKAKTWVLFALGGLGVIAPALELVQAIIPGFALATAALQGATLVSYLNKYNWFQEQPKASQNDNQEHYVETANREPQVTEYEKTKDKEQLPTNITEVPTVNPELEALAEKIVLAEEQGLFETTVSNESPKVFQKH